MHVHLKRDARGRRVSIHVHEPPVLALTRGCAHVDTGEFVGGRSGLKPSVFVKQPALQRRADVAGPEINPSVAHFVGPRDLKTHRRVGSQHYLHATTLNNADVATIAWSSLATVTRALLVPPTAGSTVLRSNLLASTADIAHEPV